MPRYRKWPKSFLFEEPARRSMQFVGVALHPERHRLELARPLGGVYPIAPDLHARTRVTTPEACRKWCGFMAISKTPPGTDVRFRLNDGVIDRYWNSGANDWVPAAPNNWNTEIEIADHIDAWPTQALSVVIMLSTTDPTVTPWVSEVRLLFDTDLVSLEDYVVRSYIEALRENFRGVSIYAVKSTGQTSIDLGKLQTPYDIVDVDAVYNNAADPMHMHPLAGCSYDAGTKLLSIPAQPVGNTLDVRFAWRPHVVLMQSQDYTEIPRIPAIVVDGVDVVNRSVIRERPYVLNKGTMQGFAFDNGYQADLDVPLKLLCASSRDLHVMSEEASRFFANNPLIRVRGQDEFYPICDDGVFDDVSSASQKEMHSARVQARIRNAVFYPEDARPITGVSSFVVTGGLSIEVP
jgi:hypothetical protein